MSRILDGITIETFPEAVRLGAIKPGQRFTILLDDERPKLADIAQKMRATAVAKGMTTEIFDTLLSQA